MINIMKNGKLNRGEYILGNIREYIGYWWLPDNGNDRLYGSLKIYDDNKLELKVLGMFGGLEEHRNHISINTINGFTQCGKKITLLKCYEDNCKFSMPGIASENYTPQYMIIGEHFKYMDDIKINSISSRYTDLSKWIGIVPFKRKIHNEKEFVLSYKLPEQKIYELTNHTIKITFNANMNRDSLKQFTITQSIDIKFEELKEKSFELTLDLIYDFSKFLTLWIGEKVNLYNIEAVAENDTKIFIFWNNMALDRDSDEAWDKILVPYSFVEDNFQQYLENWYEKKEKLKPIINYVVEAYEKVFQIPMSFLKIIQAFEAFSRRMRNNCNIDSEAHEKRVEYIINKIDNEDYKTWLEERLRYSNEPNLSSRIKSLFMELNFIINMSNTKKKNIASKITNTRNYYTHFDDSNKENAMSSDEIFYITKYMLLGLRVLIMMELGVEKEFIKSQIDNLDELWLNRLKKEFNLDS